MFNRILLVILSLNQYEIVFTQEPTLRQLFVIFRHGDRAPITLYADDPNSEADFPDGLGELTNIGKKEQYELGRYLRNRYATFLSDDPREAKINSSNVNRCLDSVESHLAGLYPPVGRHVWNDKLNWQPIPIHTRFESEDNVLTLTPDCPEYDKERERIYQTPSVKEYVEKHKPLLKYLTNHTGQKVDNLQNAAYIFDTLQIEKLKELMVPEWATPIWDEMRDVENFKFYIDISSPLAKRLKGGPILKDIISKIQLKAHKSKTLKEKVFIYSTHDTVVTALTSAMNVYNKIAPPYCATVLIELHEKGLRNHSVRIWYKNGTTFPIDPSEPVYPLVIPGCREDCPLGQFIRLTKDSVPDDWARECGLQDKPDSFSPTALSVIYIMGIILILLVLSTVVMLWLRCQKEKSGVRYSRVPEDTMIN